MPLLQHRHRRFIRLRRQIGICALLMRIGLELHDRPHQLLGKPVVDLIGDQLALVVARLQQMLQRAIARVPGVRESRLRSVTSWKMLIRQGRPL